MRKVLSFSGFLMLGLVISQFLPMIAGEGYGTVKVLSNILLYVCLSFIMINVGREFVLDKVRWKVMPGLSYSDGYSCPALVHDCYLLCIRASPPDYWNSWEAWKENLLLSRFAAPTSAGILFTMLAAIGLKSSWIYKKIQVLAIFDDLDTILLMIPLQIMMIGLRWQLIIVVVIVFMLLSIGWKQLNKYNWRQDWKAILFYSVIIFLATQILYLGSKELYGEEGSIHIEVLLPAFVLGMIMKHKEHDTPVERKVSTGISFLFMFLVGMSMPHLSELTLRKTHTGTHSVTGSQEMMSWGMILFHVVIVSFLSNIGKLCPMFFYRDRKLSERLALSIGMFTRGEVGAGIIFIALGYNLGGPALVISVLTLVLNLILTGIFVLWVKNLALRSYND